MLKLSQKNFKIWGHSYDVWEDRYNNYYFRNVYSGSWVTPAHQRYYPRRYPFDFNTLFRLIYEDKVRNITPTYNPFFSLIAKDDVWSQPVVLGSDHGVIKL